MSEAEEFFSAAPTWVLIGGAILVVVVLAALLAAAYQGREVSIWPPRIGPRAEKTGLDRQATEGVGTPGAETEPTAHEGQPPVARPTPPQRWRHYVIVDHDKLFGNVEVLINDVADAVLAAGSSPVVSITGEGGIGKTAVAYEVVRGCTRTDTFSRTAWISAMSDVGRNGARQQRQTSTVSPVSIQLGNVLRSLADQLGMRVGLTRALWEQELTEQIAALPDGERALTVIDNIESLGEGKDAVSYVQSLGLGSPHKIIVTTRWSLSDALSSVNEFRVLPLSNGDALALAVHLGRRHIDLRQADEGVLQPILTVTEGNPYLIKLVIRHFLSTHRSLDMVLAELTTLDSNLADHVRDHLYVRSLLELERQFGAEASKALMSAFCTKRRGETFSYDELQDIAGVQGHEFREMLEGACRLSLITASSLNERYSIHSLLHEFRCRRPSV